MGQLKCISERGVEDLDWQIFDRRKLEPGSPRAILRGGLALDDVWGVKRRDPGKGEQEAS
jgi:hypothetical protein